MPPVAAPPPPSAAREREKFVEYEEFIDGRIESTRRGLKLVDLAATLVVLAVATFGFLLLTAVVEHWLFSHGMPQAVRLALFVGFTGFCGWYLWRRVAPLVLHRINPDYAAQAIERENPTLKNSLLSFLQLRPHRTKMPQAVLAAVEEQAARGLSSHEVETAVDRTQLVRAGTILVVMLAVGTLYTILSPKSLMTSAARMLVPWADIAPPSRVQITNITPGDAHLIQGDGLEASARVTRLRADETVELEIAPVDGDVYTVPMRSNESDPSRYSVRLPDDPSTAPLGLQQSFDYRILAGDAQSRRYSVSVDPAPTMRVTEVRYEFPPYTGYVNRTVEGLADLRAIEGTRVTIISEANSDIASAHVDFAADGRNDLSMKVDERQAAISFVLERPADGSDPPSSYTLRYKTTEGASNRQPPVHVIEVVPDLPPEVELVEPEARVIEVAVDESVKLVTEARDPDFALGSVAVEMQKEDGAALPTHLLADKPHRGRFTGEWTFTPRQLKLKPGDVVTYWVHAEDNRTPQPGTSETERRELRVIGPANDQPNQGNQQEGAGDGQPQQAPPQPGEGGQGDPQQGDPQQGEPNGDPGEGADGEGNQDNSGAEGNTGGEPSADSADNQGDRENQGDDSGSEENNEPGAEGGTPGEMQERGESGDSDNQNGNSGGEQSDTPSGDNSEQSPSGNGGNNATEQSPDGGQENGGQENTGGGGESGPNNGAEGDPNSRGQQGDGGGNADQPSKPVAPDGSDDASAFDRIRRRLNEEERQNAQRQPGQSDPSQANPSNSDPQESDGDPSDKPRESGSTQESANGERNGENQSAEQDGEPGESGEQSPKDRGTGGADDPMQDESTAGQPADETGEQASGGADPTTEKPEPRSDGGAGDGAGQTGSPEAQRNATPRDKSQQESEDPQGEDAAQSPGTSGNESDSQGDSAGDREGGGDKGGGQQAPREGTGSDGANEAADSGSDQSADEGPGSTGDEGGPGEQADGETGTAGEQPGEGSETQPGSEQPGTEQPGGEQPGGNSGDAGDGRPENMTDSPDGNPGSMPIGGGNGGLGTGDEIPPGGDPLAGDKANLDYAKEQTDLVLENLEDQLNKNKVDEQLLDDLGWTEEQLRQFVERWQSRKQTAESGDAAAQVELDEALRTLDLKPGTVGGESSRTSDDNRNFSEGQRRETPAKYRDRLKWYTEGLSRGRE